jgi:uncharacterized protein (UPF0332 family)
MNVKDLIEERYLEKIEIDEKLISKELKESDYDLKKAKDALEENDFKWSIIKSYYSMFHAAKAVLFSLGFREKRHFVIGIILERLSMEGKLQFKYINDYKGAMMAREDADYRYVYTRDTAEYLVEIAEEFTVKMKEILKANKT